MKNVWPRFMQNISKLNFYVISGKKYFTFINEYAAASSFMRPHIFQFAKCWSVEGNSHTSLPY